MGLLKNFFKAKETTINTNEDFWSWFLDNEKDFFKVIKTRGNIERDFFNQLSLKLNQLKDGYWFLAGMLDDSTAELILTADGNYKNIVFVEELVQSAPAIKNWKITALKPALDIKDVSISIGELEFNKENLSFYANEDSKFPDEIDINVVYAEYKDELKAQITNGVYIFIDNYLGELNSITTIDNMNIIGKSLRHKELIPIEKLKGYLIWRQKEFIEKYEGTWYDSENANYSSLQATLDSGNPLIAIVNSDLLAWDSKASHPWILIIEINYKGNEYGMPDENSMQLMNDFEDNVILKLKNAEGYLNVGRQTTEGFREIYFACKDFRLPSKVLNELQLKYQGKLDVDYSIYKDKYWKSFDRLKPAP